MQMVLTLVDLIFLLSLEDLELSKEHETQREGTVWLQFIEINCWELGAKME